MEKSDINVLIVEDDPQVLQSLVKVVEKTGYKAVPAKHADEAVSLAKIKTIHAAIIDCMLPKKNGLDLSLELKSKMSDNAPIILMSGIFKDKNYASDALIKTGAVEFLYKPIDLNHIATALNDNLKELVSAPKVDLHVLLSQPFASQRERRKAFDHVEDLSGYDLPFVFCILMDAESTGFLNIINENNDIYGVTIIKGKIVKVDSSESAKVVERLLVRHGFATEDDIMRAQYQKGDLFKNLIKDSLISPHVLEIIRPEQMVRDLNHLIKGEKLKINFVPDRKLKAEGPMIDIAGFNPQLHDMVETLISQQWLVEFYSVWQGHSIQKGPQYNENHQLFSLPIFQRVPGLVNLLIKKEPTIEEVFQSSETKEVHFYKALHLLMIRRLFVFSEGKKVSNSGEHIGRIRKMWEALNGKTPFEVFKYFGVSEEFPSNEIEVIYKEFAKNNHPDILPQNMSEEDKKINHQLFSLVSDSHDILTDKDKKKKFLNKIKQKDAEDQIRSESLTSEAITLVSRGKFSDAFEKMKLAKDLYKDEHVEIVYIWTFVKSHNEVPQAKLQEFSKSLKAMSFDTKKGLYYSFVSALVKKGLGDLEGAKVDLQKSLMIKNDFMVARRELTALKSESKKGTDIFNADIGKLVGNLFKRKK